ncbi:MAG: phosphatase PAP2 family protein [Actinobacteria bacterium]|nr:phosphatase PAP2 family protein [Actinomycetota bacterium]
MRNQFGSAAVDPSVAYDNALLVIRIEQAFGTYVEPAMQDLVLALPGAVIRLWNLYYGTLHFVVTGAAMVLLFRRAPARYRTCRTTLAVMTGSALIGFSAFPLMPPRLLAAGGPFGGAAYGGLVYADQFVDTMVTHPTLWSFSSDTMVAISNQYAAMPSLHIGWSIWCTAALLPLARRRRVRVALWAYPPLTLVSIVVTANHYWIDALGGVAVFAVGRGVAELVRRRRSGSAELATTG